MLLLCEDFIYWWWYSRRKDSFEYLIAYIAHIGSILKYSDINKKVPEVYTKIFWSVRWKDPLNVKLQIRRFGQYLSFLPSLGLSDNGFWLPDDYEM